MGHCLKILTEIYTSTSIGEAQSSASQLKVLIDQVLESNSEISRRLAHLEMQTLGHSRSTVQPLAAQTIHRDGHAMVVTKAAIEGDKVSFSSSEHIRTCEENIGKSSAETEDLEGPNFRFTFDQDLNNSRVYARALKRGSVWSAVSSAVHTTSWSCLSGLSLADFSELSVLGLPIYAQELSNGHRFELTDLELVQALEKSDIYNMDDHVDVRHHGFSENDKRALKARRAISLHKRLRSMGGRSVLDMDRQSRKPSITVGGNVLEPKRIMLVGMTPSRFGST